MLTAPGAHHWRLMLIEVVGNGMGDLITLGDGDQTSLTRVPHDLVLDRVYIHGDAAAGQKRGIALNSASTTITGSYISDIKAVGQDSQAICGWNGPGPFTITNNYLEAAGENMLFGGADPCDHRTWCPPTSRLPATSSASRLAWRGAELGRQEPVRVEKRATGLRVRQHVREQLGRRPARLRDPVHGLAIRTAAARGARSTM